MSLFADWPCVFLHRRPRGTAGTLRGPGPASRTATLTFSLPIDIDSTTAAFSAAPLRSAHLQSPSRLFLSAFYSLPAS